MVASALALMRLEPSLAPRQSIGVPTLVGIACGYAHTLLLAADGRLYAAGSNSCGQLGVHPGAAIMERTAQRQASSVLAIVRAESTEGTAPIEGRGRGGSQPWLTPEDLCESAAVGAVERLVPLPSHATRPEVISGGPAFQNAVVMSVAAGWELQQLHDTAGRLWMWGWAEDGNGAAAWTATRGNHVSSPASST